jgi:Family of unknown function (DUF6460)
MLEGLLQTLVKVAVASLIVGTVLVHFGITVDLLVHETGFSTDHVEDLARRALTWAMPNILLGAVIIVPLWFIAFLLRPPRQKSE